VRLRIRKNSCQASSRFSSPVARAARKHEVAKLISTVRLGVIDVTIATRLTELLAAVSAPPFKVFSQGIDIARAAIDDFVYGPPH
jgi:hypothetical protein